MNVFVMGATGKVGRALHRYWSEVSEPPFSVLWQSRTKVAGDPWIAWDPLNETVPQLPRLDAAIVLSGVTPGGGGEMSWNTDLALAGLRAGAARGAKHVFLASSQAVYAPTGKAMDEGADVDPGNPYGVAKAEMERAARKWCAENASNTLGLTCLRIGNVAGADMLGQSVAKGAGIRLDRFEDGEGPERSYIGAGGFARVLESLMAAVDTGDDVPDVLNVAAPGATRMSDLLRAWDRSWDWQDAPVSARQSVALDVSRLGGLHDFVPSDSDAAQMVQEWERLGRK